jgi:hypothetical protein
MHWGKPQAPLEDWKWIHPIVACVHYGAFPEIATWLILPVAYACLKD